MEDDQRFSKGLFDAPGERQADDQPGEDGLEVESAAADAIGPDWAGGQGVRRLIGFRLLFRDQVFGSTGLTNALQIRPRTRKPARM